MRRPLMLLLLSVLAGCASSSTVPGDSGGHFVPRELTHVPRPLPVLLFLHGSGERGDDGIKPTEAGVGPWIKQHMDSFPALAVFPQVPEGEEWRGRNVRMALAVLDAANAEFSTDPARNYISGMSMGGYGTWELALTRPTQFAAVMPICGALLAPRAERAGLVVDQVAGIADPYEAVASRLHGVPVWMFHGALDALVPPRDDQAIAQASEKLQAGFRYTEYPDTQHNAWDPTYRNPAVWEWMFTQRRQ